MEKYKNNPQKNIPHPKKIITPAQPDINQDPTIPKTGGNEPEKNDPTRKDEPHNDPI